MHPCVILCGGRSSRMGSDKSLLPFGGFKTLTHFQASRLKSLFSSLHVNAKTDKFNGDFELIKDSDQEIYSPMVALYSILSHFKNEWVFCISVDTPFVGEEVISELEKNLKGDCVIATCRGVKHPLCGFYHSRILPKIEELLKEDIHKIGALLSCVDTLHVEFEDEKTFTNLNHFVEYEAALKVQCKPSQQPNRA